MKYYIRSLCIKLFYAFIVLFIFMVDVNAKEVHDKDKNLVNLYFFHSDTCSHCAEEEKLLDKLESNYANLKIYRYEIHDKETERILEMIEDIYKIKMNGVPITIIGDEVYIGYNEKISKLKFIQTIEYYSRYFYRDQLGEQIGVKNLPFYKQKENQMTLEEFMDEFGNYTLIGIFETKSLDSNLIATLTGIISGFNPIFIVCLIGIIILSRKFFSEKCEQLLLEYFFFFICFFILNISVIKNQFYSIIILVCLVLLFVWNLLKYFKYKDKKYILFNFLIILSWIICFLSNNYYNNAVQIFLNILDTYLIDGINKGICYINYLIGYLVTQLVIVLFLNIFANNFFERHF